MAIFRTLTVFFYVGLFSEKEGRHRYRVIECNEDLRNILKDFLVRLFGLVWLADY